MGYKHKLIQKISLFCLVLGWGGFIQVVKAESQAPKLELQSAIAIDALNGQILFEQDSDQTAEVGALSKVILLYLIYQAIDQGKITLSETVPISDQAYQISQDYNIANVPLRQDFEYTVEELLEAVAITQANGAALALAEHLAGSEHAYLELANQQLADWGISHSQLFNSTGLPTNYGAEQGEQAAPPKQNQLSAEALAIATYQLVKHHPEYLDWSKQPQATFKAETDDAYPMTNHNDMIGEGNFVYEGMLGLLQDKTANDKGNFLGVIERNGFKVITVVLGASQVEARFSVTKQVADYVFSAYAPQTIVRQGDSVTQIPELKSSQGERAKIVPIYSRDVTLIVPMIDTTPRYTYHFIANSDNVTKDDDVKAPLSAGSKLGEVLITLKTGELTYLKTSQANKVPIELDQDLKEAPWYAKLWRGITNMLQGIWEAIRKFFVNLFN